MKKALLAIALFSASLSNLFGQDFQFGVRFDPQLAWLNESSEYLESDGARLAFRFGLMADVKFSQNYAISTGLFLDRRGGNLSFKENNSRYKPADHKNIFFYEHSIQYLEIPLTLRLTSNELSSGIRIYGQTGINLGILTEYKIDGEERESGGSRVEFTDRNFDNSNPFNPSFIFGGGVEYPLDGQLAVMGGLAYQQGFINASDIDNYDYQTSRLSLQLGLLF